MGFGYVASIVCECGVKCLVVFGFNSVVVPVVLDLLDFISYDCCVCLVGRFSVGFGLSMVAFVLLVVLVGLVAVCVLLGCLLLVLRVLFRCVLRLGLLVRICCLVACLSMGVCSFVWVLSGLWVLW